MFPKSARKSDTEKKETSLIDSQVEISFHLLLYTRATDTNTVIQKNFLTHNRDHKPTSIHRFSKRNKSRESQSSWINRAFLLAVHIVCQKSRPAFSLPLNLVGKIPCFQQSVDLSNPSIRVTDRSSLFSPQSFTVSVAAVGPHIRVRDRSSGRRGKRPQREILCTVREMRRMSLKGELN